MKRIIFSFWMLIIVLLYSCGNEESFPHDISIYKDGTEYWFIKFLPGDYNENSQEYGITCDLGDGLHTYNSFRPFKYDEYLYSDSFSTMGTETISFCLGEDFGLFDKKQKYSKIMTFKTSDLKYYTEVKYNAIENKIYWDKIDNNVSYYLMPKKECIKNKTEFSTTNLSKWSSYYIAIEINQHYVQISDEFCIADLYTE